VERLSIGNAGWVRYAADGGPVAYLRFMPDERGRYLLRELVLDSEGGAPVTTAAVQRLPLAQVEAFVNGDAATRAVLDARRALVAPVGGPADGSNVAVLASHYATTYGRTDPTTNWCAAAQAATYDDAPRKVRRRAAPAAPRAEIDRDYHLDGPPGADGLTLNFLTRVARAYVAALARGEAPNQTIARDVTTSPRTVERWVYVARQRGIMPPGRKGARG
jgi:hypothetical protein